MQHQLQGRLSCLLLSNKLKTTVCSHKALTLLLVLAVRLGVPDATGVALGTLAGVGLVPFLLFAVRRLLPEGCK